MDNEHKNEFGEPVQNDQVNGSDYGFENNDSNVNNDNCGNNSYGNSNDSYGNSNNGYGNSNESYGGSNNGYGYNNAGYGNGNNMYGNGNNNYGNNHNRNGRKTPKIVAIVCGAVAVLIMTAVLATLMTNVLAGVDKKVDENDRHPQHTQGCDVAFLHAAAADVLDHPQHGRKDNKGKEGFQVLDEFAGHEEDQKLKGAEGGKTRRLREDDRPDGCPKGEKNFGQRYQISHSIFPPFSS